MSTSHRTRSLPKHLHNPQLLGSRHSWRVDRKELSYLQELLSGGFPESGAATNFVKRLEIAFAERFSCRYAISHANGTATLHSALAAAGVGPGDEVIVPPLTMASTSLAVLQQRATPVFADVDADTFNIDPASIAQRITDRTKAIIPVALYGLAPDMDPIMELAAKHNLVVIEDAAQCFLGRYKNRLVGTIGHLASFSFQNSKHMTCGEGGIVITDDRELADKAARFASLGYGLVTAEPGKSQISREAIAHPSFKRHVSLGFNYRMAEPCAAIALAQLEKIDHFVACRRRCAQAWSEVVADCDWLAPQYVSPECESADWAYTVRLDTGDDGPNWDEFVAKFRECGGDMAYGAWCVTYLEPMFQSGDFGVYEPGLCPVAERIQPRLIQFKTNYGDQKTFGRQVEALAKTIAYY